MLAMDEREAITRAKRHDPAGLEGLVQLHQQQAVRLATLITRDRQTAEDVVSECFLVAYERIHQFDEQRPFRPWFHRIVANAALKTVSRQGRLASLENLANDDGTIERVLGRLVDSAPDPLEVAEQTEVRAAVQAALASLSPKQRAVLALRYYSDFSEAETAVALGIPRGTVKSRLAAGIERLRALLADLRPR
jgi:RNA polymerase sigma-70 factor (ECF subfamily)